MAQLQSVQTETLARDLGQGTVEDLGHVLRGQDAVLAEAGFHPGTDQLAQAFPGGHGPQNAAIGRTSGGGRTKDRERVDLEGDQKRRDSLVTHHLVERALVDVLAAREQRHLELPGRTFGAEGERGHFLGQLVVGGQQVGNDERGHG